MVAFARAKAKSIFSKLWLTPIAMVQTSIQTNTESKKEVIADPKEKGSNYFLEAIKRGGIWLS